MAFLRYKIIIFVNDWLYLVKDGCKPPILDWISGENMVAQHKD